MVSRLGIRELIGDQLDTMHVSGSSKRSKYDLLLLFGLPFAPAVAVVLTGARFTSVGQVLSGMAILTGLLFGLLVHVFSVGLRVADTSKYNPSSKVTVLVDELRANVSYACGVSLALTGVLVVAAVNAGARADINGLHPVVSGFIALLGLHLVLVLLLVLKRVRNAYKLLT